MIIIVIRRRMSFLVSVVFHPFVLHVFTSVFARSFLVQMEPDVSRREVTTQFSYALVIWRQLGVYQPSGQVSFPLNVVVYLLKH